MKKIIVASDEEWFPECRESVEDYAWRTGAEIELAVPAGSCAWGDGQMWSRWECYFGATGDEFLVIDNDVWVSPEAPDVFLEGPFAVKFPLEPGQAEFSGWAERSGLQAKWMVNAGVLRLDRGALSAMEDIFRSEDPRSLNGFWYDQGFVSYALSRAGVDMDGDPRWNWTYPNTRGWRDDAWFYHPAGRWMGKEKKAGAIAHIKNRWEAAWTGRA